MSTYVLMRILESAPSRYDLGIRLLTLGRLDRAYDRLASHVERDQRVLDLGCGTGALTLRACRRGASVKGIDINAQMLEIARLRLAESEFSPSVDLAEMGVAELDAEEGRSYDVVMSGLCLSELSEDEVRYTLKEVTRLLRPGGLVLIADEIRPKGLFRRLTHALARAPLVFITYLFTQQTTHPAADLENKLKESGFEIVSIHRNWPGSFGEFVARKPMDGAS